MKLKECHIGMIVEMKDGATNVSDIGHIVGLTHRNSSVVWSVNAPACDVIPLVLFVGEITPRGVAADNIQRIK